MQSPELDDAGRYRTLMSCLECSRRKIRCDKRFPCRACRERGDADTCRPRQLPTKRPRASAATVTGGGQRGARGARGGANATSSEIQPQVEAELSALRSRLDEVEAMLNIKHSPHNGSNIHSNNGSQSLDDDGDHDFQEDGLAGAMEEAALGIGQNQRWRGAALLEEGHDSDYTGQSASWYSFVPLHECLATLPSRTQSQVLLDWYCDHLDSMFGCLHRPTITHQHAVFWDRCEQGQCEDDMFVALIFSVLSVSANFFDSHDVYTFMPQPRELESCAVVWFDCALATLFRCHGLTRPSLLTCQSVITLNFSFNLSGNTSIHGTLAHMLIRIARTMNLHLLGSNQSGTDAQRLKRELGRRAWWQIVEAEWAFFPYNRFTSIDARHFDTSLPSLDDCGNMQTLSSQNCHSLSFLLASCRSVQVLYDLYGSLRPSEQPPYPSVLSASQKLDAIVKELPRELKEPAQLDVDPTHPSVADVTRRRYLSMMLAYRSYLIHRAYFVKSLEDDSYRASRVSCVAAAETLVSLAQKGLTPSFHKLWTTTIWLVSAGIVLALDLFHSASPLDYPSPRQPTDQHRKLADLIELLRNVNDRSGIGSRGSKLIAHICSTQRKVQDGTTLKLFSSRQELMDLTRSSADTTARNDQDLNTSGHVEDGQDHSLSRFPQLAGSDLQGPFYDESLLFPSLPEGLGFFCDSISDPFAPIDIELDGSYMRNDA